MKYNMTFSATNPFKRALSLLSVFDVSKLTNDLGALKGPIMKAAQFLSTIPGAIPTKYADKLISLQTNAPPMNINLVREQIEKELGQNWISYFNSFEENSCSAASLGQVHKANYKGKTVACKIQYPSMDKVINADLKIIKFVLNTLYKFQSAIDHSRIFIELEEYLNKELDYELELSNMQRYGDIFKNNDFIIIPKPYPAISTKKFLVMDFIVGNSILDEKYSTDEKHSLAKKLFKSWYYPFYKHGLLHADPHPGNYKISDELKIQLLDFGCIREFEEKSINAVKLLYEGLKHQNVKTQKDAYYELGFEDLTITDVLNEWAKLLFGPLLHNKIRPIQPNFNAKHGFETACIVYKKLKAAGGVCPPREFVFMDRVAVCLGGVFMKLKVELNWHEMFEEILYT